MNAVTSKNGKKRQEFYKKGRQVLQNAQTIKEFKIGSFLYTSWDFRHLMDMTLDIPLFHTGNLSVRITHYKFLFFDNIWEAELYRKRVEV